MTNSASKSQSTHSRGGNDSTRSGESEEIVGMIHVAPGASAADRDRARGLIDPSVLNPRQIDDQSVIGNSKSSGVMPSAPNREQDAIFSGEVNAMNDVGDIGTSRN